jgi:hypothetical protein
MNAGAFPRLVSWLFSITGMLESGASAHLPEYNNTIAQKVQSV